MREVSLISRSTLLNTLPAAAGNFALQWLKKRKNVRVLLGDEIVGEPFTDTSTSTSADAVGGGSNGQRNDTMSYRTKNGEVLQCDLFIDCTGRYMKVSPPTITATDITTSVTASEGESSSDNNNDHKSFIWPFDKNGLIMVDEHLMVRTSYGTDQYCTYAEYLLPFTCLCLMIYDLHYAKIQLLEI